MAPERVAQQLSRKALEEEWRLAFSDAFFMQFRHFVSHNIEVAQDVDQLSGAMSINEFESRVGEAWSANRVLCVNDPKNELEWRDSIADTIPSVFQDCYGEVTTVEIEPQNPEIEEEDIGIERIVVEVFGPPDMVGEVQHHISDMMISASSLDSTDVLPTETYTRVTSIPKVNASPPYSEVANDLLETVPWGREVIGFSAGFESKRPSPETIRVANQIVRSAKEQTLEHEMYVDDTDGALGFMLRLNNGLLLLAELSVDGVLSGGTYDDSDSGGKQVEFIDNATVNQMLELF